MIRLQLPINENIELLLSAIGYERCTSFHLGLEAFLSDKKQGHFSKKEYLLTGTMDMQSHIKILENGNDMILVLHPRSAEVDETLQKIIDAFNISKNEQGVVNPMLFSQLISQRAAEGVDEYLQTINN